MTKSNVNVSPMFSPKSFMVLSPLCISLIQSELIFLRDGFCPISFSCVWATLSCFFVRVLIFVENRTFWIYYMDILEIGLSHSQRFLVPACGDLELQPVSFPNCFLNVWSLCVPSAASAPLSAWSVRAGGSSGQLCGLIQIQSSMCMWGSRRPQGSLLC